MSARFWRTASWLAIALVAGLAGAVRAEPPPGGADLQPPVVVHVAPEVLVANGALRIHARILDESGIREAWVFYRTAGEPDYRRSRMVPEAEPDFFAAELPGNIGPEIEYFFRATDEAGNTVLGQLLDPYVTRVARPGGKGGVTGSADASSPGAASRPAGRAGLAKGWIWAGVGLAVVAALAAGGGSGGGAAPAAEVPGSGTVTIVAPPP